jgi:D-alanine-D-alanine ligase-like ATP-grasp enzyme
MFHILGFDVFIDKSLKAWLIEINDHPSLSIGAKNSEGRVISEIDHFIKTRVVGSAI